MTGTLTLQLVLAAAVGVVAVLGAREFGRRSGWLDDPDRDPALTAHTQPTPATGGLGIALAIGVAVAVDSPPAAMLVALGVAFGLGLADDRLSLPPALRFGVLLATGVLVGLPESVAAQPWSILLAVPLVVATANAVNLFDGLDGLVGANGAVAAAGIAAIGLDVDATPRLAVCVTGALLGFLVWNWNPASVFMGNAGSYLVGVTLAAAVLEAGAQASWPQRCAIAGCLGTFAVDLAVTLFRRFRGGVPLFTGDRSHLYDQMRDRGLSVRAVAAATAVAQAVIATVCIVAARLDGGACIAVLAGLGVALVVAVWRAGFVTPAVRA